MLYEIQVLLSGGKENEEKLASCGNSGSGSGNGSDSTSKESGETSVSASEESGAEGEGTAVYTPNFDEDPYTVHFQYLVAAE